MKYILISHIIHAPIDIIIMSVKLSWVKKGDAGQNKGYILMKAKGQEPNE